MEPVLDRLMVKAKAWDEARIDALVQELGAKLISKTAPIGWFQVSIDPRKAADAYEAFASHPEVADVWFPRSVKRASVTAYNAAFNDPLADTQHSLKRMNVYHAWKYTRGAGIKVATVDNGTAYPTFSGNPVNQLYPYDIVREFANRNMERWNSVYNATTWTDPNTGDYYDENALCGTAGGVSRFPGHGTDCLAVMAGNAGDGYGPSGVAPETDLLGIRCYDVFTLGSCADTDITAGFINAVDKGARIISCSQSDYAQSLPSSMPSYFTDAMNYVTAHNALVFIAAGNEALGDGYYEYFSSWAALVGHFRVGCVTIEQLDRPSQYTNYGQYVQVATPGHINYGPSGCWYQAVTDSTKGLCAPPPGWVSGLGDGAYTDGTVGIDYSVRTPYNAFNGTSCATPLAAGVAALILSANPALTTSQLHDLILATGDVGQHEEFRSMLYNAVIPNAAKGVLAAMSMVPANAGVVYPYVGFYGAGAQVTVTNGVARTDLHGSVLLELDGFSSDPITNVQLWAGANLIYSGPPRRNRDHNMLAVSGALFAGQQLRIVVSTANATADETYSDVSGHATSSASPLTSVVQAGGSIVFTSQSENAPVTVNYRFNQGPWQSAQADKMSDLITDPPGRIFTLPVQVPGNGRIQLDFYGVDALGNVEGGVDYAHA